MDWRDIPSLSALRAFEAAARHKSLSSAARELNVTHAAVAQHVRTLEDRFGTRLLQRDGRGMAATPNGARLAAALGDGFAAIASGVRALDDTTRLRPLRITLTPSFAANWLMPRIGSFWAAHPDIRLEILPAFDLVDMRTGEVDIAIRYGRGGWPDVTEEVLVPAGHAIVAAPSLIAQMGDTGTESLRAQHWLLEGGRTEERLWAASLGIDLDTVRLTRFETNTLVIQAVIAGHGVSIIPEAIASAEVAQGRLTIIHAENDSPLAYRILTRPGHGSPAQSAFLTWLRNSV